MSLPEGCSFMSSVQNNNVISYNYNLRYILRDQNSTYYDKSIYVEDSLDIWPTFMT
jgi:hypothetical protein